MGIDARQDALFYLINQSEKQGYITFDDIMNCADAMSLSIQDFDWLSGAVTTRGILVYDETPLNRISLVEDDEDYADYAQSDYEAVYDRIIEKDNSLGVFIEEVRNIIPPQWREFGTLKYQVIEGNQHARNRIIEMHLRIALKLALQRAETYDMDISDAIEGACIGLVKAVDKYNPDVNGPFGSYASMWILQSISRIQTTRRPLVYYPVHKKNIFFSAYTVLKEYGFMDHPEDFEINDIKTLLAEKLSLNDKQIKDVLIAAIPLESYEEIFSEYSENYQVFEKQEFEEDMSVLLPKDYVYYVDFEHDFACKSLKKQLHETLNTLTQREKKVIELRYGLNDGRDRTLEEVGKEFNVSRERIRQIESKALRKLRHPLRRRRLLDYIEVYPTVLHKEDRESMTGDTTDVIPNMRHTNSFTGSVNQPRNSSNYMDGVEQKQINTSNTQEQRFLEGDQVIKKKRGRPPKMRVIEGISKPVPKRKSGRPKKQL